MGGISTHCSHRNFFELGPVYMPKTIAKLSNFKRLDRRLIFAQPTTIGVSK
jgi:hypothetical protein